MCGGALGWRLVEEHCDRGRRHAFRDLALSRAATLVVANSLAGVAASCSDDPRESRPVDCGPPPAAFEVGTGTRAFEAIADGDRVFARCGSQGGRHVDIQLRATGVAGPTAQYSATLADRTTGRLIAVSGGPRSFRFHAVDDSCYSPDGLRVVIMPATADIADHEAILHAEITDQDGLALSDSRNVVIDVSLVWCKG